MDIKAVGERLPYVLVAEALLLPLIGVVIAGLKKYANPASITLVVPKHQTDAFKSTVGESATVISEDAVLPDWHISRVRDRLAHQNRAGWYLQQFLKLSFGQFSGAPAYVIWDADTIPLAPPLLRDGEMTLFCAAQEHNPPYFDTYKLLLGLEPVLKRSAISQYMYIETSIVEDLQSTIIENAGASTWIEAILDALPGESISEFSEYETYANFFMSRHPGRGRMIDVPWFRYGAEIYPDCAQVTLEDLEKRFARYSHVAFERHPRRFLRRAAAHSKLFFGL